ncbi:MAG: S46 family peptidase [Marinilabiliaceae bacterium]|nr:S46 family peptidase [Marinilabiliaceae bacterium]
MKRLLGMIVASVITVTATADEGMWILPLLKKMNIDVMKEKGLCISAEEIYSANKSSIKDAVIIFGGGCTGEIVSPKGLIFTNHHCGYSSIQKLSSVDHNYLRDGFWAKGYAEELPVDGLTVKFLTQMTDVTSEILKDLDVLAGTVNTDNKKSTENKSPYFFKSFRSEYQDSIDARIRRLISKRMSDYSKEETQFHSVDVESFLEGNQYFLVEYEIFKDIRLVGTPPEAIGNFGHDTDNWMWPRHTGDFSIFRVYASKKNKPATYSTDNVPYTPKHYLPISIKGTEKSDFAMTIGFPGSTSRYLTSWGIKHTMEVENASRILPREKKQNIWMEDMLADEKIKLQYASKYASSSNYWKNAIGMNRGLKRLHIIEKKRELEREFEEFARGKKGYEDVLANLKYAYEANYSYAKAYAYLIECLYNGTEIFKCSAMIRKYKQILEYPAVSKEIFEGIKSEFRAFYKDYSAKTDEKVCAALLKLYKETVEEYYLPEFYKQIEKKYGEDFKGYAREIFAKSIFADSTRLFKYIDSHKSGSLSKDMAYKIYGQFLDKLQGLTGRMEENDWKIEDNNRRFIKGLMEMYPNKKFYSDANFTMRLSYGTVGDYEPADAVMYKHYTTLTGVMEKEKPGDWEFDVPSRLKQLYESKDYGRYADKDGEMHVCFTTNNDITGGNSGSPVLNGKGQLIGLAFDGNWEAMSGDITFEEKLQKCICVDIRYVLFIIDKYGNAKNIIDELTIIG